MNKNYYLICLIVSLLILIFFVLFIQLYRRRFESAPLLGAIFKSVTGNLVDNSSAVRIELFNGVNIQKEGFTSQDYHKSKGTPEQSYDKLTDYTYSQIQYHDDINTISKQPQVYGIPSGTTFQTDICGNKFTTLVGNNIKTNFTYYTPGSYDTFGMAKYVPSYEDSVYLSKYSTGLQKSAYER